MRVRDLSPAFQADDREGELEGFAPAQAARLERSILPCIAAETARIEQRMAGLAAQIEAVPDDKDEPKDIEVSGAPIFGPDFAGATMRLTF